MKQFSYDTYLSTFTYRYGSDDMRKIFSQYREKLYWRKVWTALAQAQYKLGLLTKAEFEDIKKHSPKVDIDASQKIEEKTRHDVMAEVKFFASQCKRGGGKIHLGATSTDITDNADVLKFKDAVKIIREKLLKCLNALQKLIKENKNTVNIAFTHIQPAIVSTYGYRFANYAQDLITDLKFLDFLNGNIKGKGLKGAVGNSASYVYLFDGNEKKAEKLEKEFLKYLGLEAYEAATQTYPRKQDYLIINALSSIAQSLHRIALDIRILQSPVIGEVSEPFGENQVGSTAMPFKKNPVVCERICSLAEYIKAQPTVFWNNGADTILERTLDDSANRRIIFAESFLAIDEILNLMNKVLIGMKLDKDKIKENLDKYGPAAMLEPLMMKLSKSGLNRQVLHEEIRKINLKLGQYANAEELKKEILKTFKNKITQKELDEVMNYKNYTGLAEAKCSKIISQIRGLALQV